MVTLQGRTKRLRLLCRALSTSWQRCYQQPAGSLKVLLLLTSRCSWPPATYACTPLHTIYCSCRETLGAPFKSAYAEQAVNQHAGNQMSVWGLVQLLIAELLSISAFMAMVAPGAL